MSIRPFRDIKRKKTRAVKVGNVVVGNNNPITVQSMTNTLTKDAKATLKQINDIANEGAELVRISVPDVESILKSSFFKREKIDKIMEKISRLDNRPIKKKEVKKV